ncbi:RHS repeat domain-containing protein [Flavobacterium soli]|uniref:RHS repeat domain-containing protein n=1 Tax=Flavobacterium soli TaxID=344881 RepID=UPI0003FEA4BC|nr:RHS repeat domain-containing protein [Flavobacterium soli]
MNIRTTFYSIALLVAGISSQQVTGQEVPKVIPPSPEAATILQHSPVNVSLYTGTPNISVPFHTISHGGVEVPISLSYSTDGIRVNSIASRTGMGWSLSSGGLITRTINKLPDDVTNGYMNTTTNSNINQRYTILHLMGLDPLCTGFDTCQNYHISFETGEGARRDYEADTFNFSFLGYSGQFYYNQQEQEFNQAPLSRLKILTVKGSDKKIIGFIITDENGVKYYFGEPYNSPEHPYRLGARELVTTTKSRSVTYDGITQSPANDTNGAANVFQSWMLMDIVFPTSKETVKFYYSMENGVKTHTLIDEEFIKCDAGDSERNISYLVREFNQPSIDSIIFPSGRILFESQPYERLDLLNSHALKSMILLDKDQNFVKKMVLHTSQLTSADNNTYFYDFGEGKYRLMLDSVTEEDLSGTIKGRYGFEYNNPQALPNRFSRAIDYFGYYNGKFLNTSLIPVTYVDRRNAYFGYADRTIDPAYTQIGVLTKVTYPTGGFDSFIWENNDIGRFGGIGDSYTDHLAKGHTKLESADYATNFANNKFTKIFTVGPNVRGKAYFNVFQMTGCTGPNLNQVSCDFTITVESTDTNSGFVALNIFQSEFHHDLPSGEYRITATPKGIWVPPTQVNDPTAKAFQFFIDWKYDETPDELLYSGLRIQKIESHDKLGSLAFSKTYQYKGFVNGISSGSTPNMYDCLFKSYLYAKGSTFSTSQGMRGIKLSGVSQAPLISTHGSLVGYENVTELFNEGQQGRKEYTYSYTDNYNSQLQLEPRDYYSNIHIPNNFRNYVYCDWLRGNLKKVETYSQDSKLSKLENTYEAYGTKPIEDFGLQVYKFPAEPFGNDGFLSPLGVSWYSAVTEYHRLVQTKEIHYFEANEVNSITDYTYNSLSQLSQERSYDNGQLDVRKNYYYPSDPSMSSKPYALELKEQNRIGTPLEIITSDAIGELSRQETVYKDWDPGLGLHISPEIIMASKGGATLDPRVKYNAMDITTGNPLEVQQEGGMKISYLWGYSKTLPIAKIENATNAEIKTALGVTDLTLVNEANLTAINNLRTSLPNAMVTTYTYTPLVGVTTITDPKGDKVTYHYDNFNRLKLVKDKDGKILSENQYHYRTQN